MIFWIKIVEWFHVFVSIILGDSFCFVILIIMKM